MSSKDKKEKKRDVKNKDKELKNKDMEYECLKPKDIQWLFKVA